MTVALIDAGGANLGSVRYALARLGVEPRIVRDADELLGCERVILPGVGTATQAMLLLCERGLDVAMKGLEVPLLGICVGMQLLFERSEEGGTSCLGLIPGEVRKLRGDGSVRIPHMGWNQLRVRTKSALFDGIDDGEYVYFVHSYAVDVADCTIADAVHGHPFSAVVADGMRYGMQFHPERSSKIGLRLLHNFLQAV